MVRSSTPSSSSKTKDHASWRYDRVNQLDSEDLAEEASASAVEAVEGEMDQVFRSNVDQRMSEDTITCVLLTQITLSLRILTLRQGYQAAGLGLFRHDEIFRRHHPR